MGTRGFRIVKYRGRYWIFYNHWDSYPEGLGKSLVEGIPANPEDYQKWLQSQREYFAKWDSLLQVFLTIQPETMHRLSSDEPYVSIFHDAFDERLQQDAPPYHVTGFNDLFIEWIYTIDLDREVFSVDNGAHFHLDHISRDNKWIKALFHDHEDNRFLLPHLVPAESVATLSLDPPSFTMLTPYETLQTRLVKPKSLDHIPPSHLTGQRLRWILFDFIQLSQQQDLSATLLTWQAQDLPFRELVYFILCLATGGEHLTLVDQRRVKKPYSEGLYLGMMKDDDHEGSIELATTLGVGYHMDGLPMGSAPHETKYWFEGALICLVPQLNYPGIFEKAIVDAIEYGRANCTKDSFNAVLMSIEHLVLIKSMPDGSIDHTEVLPLIPIATHLSKDPRARYGDQALDTFYNAMFTKNDQGAERSEEMDQTSEQQDIKNDHKSEHNKDATNEEQDQEEEIKEKGVEDDHGEAKVGDEEAGKDSETTDDSEEDASMDGNGSEAGVALVQPRKIPVTDASIENSFMALIQFFEATTLETLRPTQPNEARLPEEICEIVLRNVSDIKTYNSCLKVSRRFRLICQRRPLVMDNIVFLEPLPDNLASSITTDKDNGTQHPPTPDFLAVEVSSDKQMEVWLRSSDRSNRSPAVTCLVVAGHEFNRKTFVADRNVIFSGLWVPAPKCKIPAARPKQSSMHGSQDTPWKWAFLHHEIDAETAAQILIEFWRVALRALERSSEMTHEPAWTFPPNTYCYFGTLCTFGEGDVKAVKEFRYLYLRVKRASKYRDTLWDDNFREATEHLNHTDDEQIKYGRCPEGQVLGAYDPYVFIVVGVEVRLFRWEQGFEDSVDEEARRKKLPFSGLRELNPGSTLNVCERADREEIERFLDNAEQHKQTIEARESDKCGGKKE